ncbi:MAG: hypothetical protein WCB96_09325 [Candidatus Aminicenantales bacterium]
MRIKKMADGREIITTEDGPRPKAGQPGPEMISTNNIEIIKRKRAEEKAAAEAEAAEKLSAGKEAAKNEK